MSGRIPRTSSVVSPAYFDIESDGIDQSPSSARVENTSRPSISSDTPSVSADMPVTSAMSGSYRSQSTVTAISSGRKSRAGSSIAASESYNIICAATVGRGVTPCVGLSFINISSCEAVFSQICDNQTYVKTIHKIHVHCPSKIILPATVCPPNTKSTLYSLIEDLYPDTSLVPLDRKLWSESLGMELLQSLSFKDEVEALKVALQGNFYALCAFSAAISYMEKGLHLRISLNSLRVRYQPSQDTMMIDVAAIETLELLQNSQCSRSKMSLMGLLDNTLTPMGRRMLRNNLLQPSTLKDSFLLPRYDAVGELSTNEEMFADVRKALHAFKDVEKFLTKLILIPTKVTVLDGEKAIDQVLMIKSFLQDIPALHDALCPAQCALLIKIRDLCRPEITIPIFTKLCEVIHEDVKFSTTAIDRKNQRTFAVKAGISGLLDIARQAYKEGTEAVHKYIEELNRSLGIDATLKYDNGRMYWLRLRAIEFETRPIPDELVYVVKKNRFIECQTLALKKLNRRIQQSASEVILQSDGVIEELQNYLRSKVPNLYRSSESIALLDMIASFAHLSTMESYVRPEITGTLALKSAKHPVLGKSCGEKFVPNDYYATQEYRFQIITGCNMSGKSTYIRAIVMLQIMAQIGCFVPAEFASFSIIHQVFARLSLDDNAQANLSHFAVEMRDMAYILNNINEHSLAIIDELGRATGANDGVSLSIAIGEALLQSRALIWFTTHFTQVAEFMDNYPGVLNLHMETESVADMAMLFKVTSGIVPEQKYGIELARAMGFPADFIKDALDVADQLQNARMAAQQNSEPGKVMRRRKLILNAYEALLQAADADMSDNSLANYLVRLREEFIVRMDEIESAGGDGVTT